MTTREGDQAMEDTKWAREFEFPTGKRLDKPTRAQKAVRAAVALAVAGGAGLAVHLLDGGRQEIQLPPQTIVVQKTTTVTSIVQSPPTQVVVHYPVEVNPTRCWNEPNDSQPNGIEEICGTFDQLIKSMNAMTEEIASFKQMAKEEGR